MVRLKEFFLFFTLLLLATFFIYIYKDIQQSKENIFTKIEENKINQLAYLFKNIEKDIVQTHNIKTTNDLVELLSSKTLREKQEKHLSFLLTPSIKYMYLLVKDKKGRFRFLLDASKTDKAHFYQKFDVTNEKYSMLYKVNKAQVIRQEDMENLFLTYLYPITVDGNTIAILSVDFTTKIKFTILELLKPLETFFIILIIFVFLIMLMTIFQIFHYFITRKKIFTDSLTQLFNRNYLNEISPMLNLNNYSIAMLDLDKFKLINDTYGHKTGDFVLSQSSVIFKNSIRDSDILIRYGGEEFLLFIYNRDDDSSSQVCERIRNNISKYQFSYDKQEIKIQISIGVHENPGLEKNITEAIKVADKMLYIAKSEGRDRVTIYNERTKNSQHSKVKDIDFVKEAINDDRVTCYYQPIYNYKTKQILKYEALVRILDTNDEVIFPAHFLPELKQTNIHYKLTQRILSIVFEKFTTNEDHVSININFSDLINKDIEATIINQLKKNPHLASRVTFEVLESDEIKDIKLFKEKINILHSLGVKVSIDDFGSGYSNFRTILDIEANYLKIDGSLIKNIDTNEKDFKVVKSIIHFAQVANMQTIAEYVHSKEVYDKLQQLDLDYMQGYYISKPLKELSGTEHLFSN